VKAGLEKEKACLLVLIAALADGSKVVLAVEEGYRESTLSWKFLLRSLRDRGLRMPRLVVGDGAMGLWAALDEIWPETDQQRCWNHKMTNVEDKMPKKRRAEARERLRKVVYAKTVEEAERERDRLVDWALKNGWEKAAKCLTDDWERMVTYYRYPKEHWIHLRTTNIVESPFAVVRLRTHAARRYKRSSRAAAVIWKTLLIAEKSFRRLNAPELLKEVIEGAEFKDGTRTQPAAA
jgi:putative transposase